MLTTSQAAERAGVRRQTIAMAIRLGRLRAERFGSAWAIAPADLDAWQAKRRGPGRPPNQPADSPEVIQAAVERAMRSGRGLVGDDPGAEDDLPPGNGPLPAADM